MRKIAHTLWTATWTVVFGLVGMGLIAWDRLRDRRRTADY
jgi:hypothetical protein